jgi:putative sigma-54 modulation protein
MKPTIVANGVKLSRRLREYVIRRLSLMLDRKHYSIQAMKVRISDQNGPKGGIDKHCQIHLTLPGLPTVVVTEKGRDIATMVDQAAHRATQAIDRLLSRSKSISHTKYTVPVVEPGVI